MCTLVYANDQWLSSRGLDIVMCIMFCLRRCECIAVGIGKSIVFIEFDMNAVVLLIGIFSPLMRLTWSPQSTSNIVIIWIKT